MSKHIKSYELDNILNSLGEALIITDRKGKITRMNLLAESLTGYVSSEVHGKLLKTLIYIVNNLTGEKYENLQEEALKKGKLSFQDYNAKLIIPDHAEFAITGSLSPITDSERNVNGFVMLFYNNGDCKQAEKKLGVSEEHFNGTLDAMQEGVLLIGWDWRYLFINKSAEIQSRRPSEELIGKTVMECWPGFEKTEYFRLEQKVMQERLPANIEGSFAFPDGEIHWFHWNIQPVPEGLLIVTQDITERKRAENEQRESEKKYRELINSTNDSIYVIDNDMSILDINDTVTAFLGYSREEILAMKISEIDINLSPKQIQNLINRMPVEKVQVFETTHLTKDGREIPVEVSSNLVTYRDRTVIMSIARDITERKQAEEKLAESEERFRAIFEQAAVGVAQVESRTGRFIRINQTYCDIVGYSHEEMLNSNFQRITHPEDIGKDLDNMQLLLTGKILTFSREKRYFRKDESIIWVNLSVSAMWQTGAEPDYFIAIVEDITERKQAEEKLRESEEQNRLLVETLAQGVLYQDEQGQIFAANTAAQKILGLTLEQMLGKASENPKWNIIREDGSDYPISELPTLLALKTGKPITGAVLGLTNPYTNIARWIVINSIPQFRQGETKPYRTYTTLEDITERKHAEELIKINELNLITKNKEYEALNEELIETNHRLSIAIEKAEKNNILNLNRLHLIQFSYEHSVDELLEETLNIAENLTKSCIGFFHFVDSDQNSLTLQDWSTQTKSKFCKASGRGEHYSIENAGVWVDCVHQRKPVIHNDYQSLTHKKGLPEGHAEVVRLMVVPIIHGDKIKAILGVGNKDSDYKQEDIDLLSIIAYLSWEIVERKRTLVELKIAKETAEENEKDLKEAQEIAKLGSWKFNTITGEVKWSKNYYKLVGMDSSQPPLSLEEIKEMVHPDDRDLFENKLKEIAQANKLETIYFRLIINGKVKWIQSNIVPQFDNGNLTAVSGVSIDITELKKAEKNLQNSESKFRSIAENLSDVIAITDNIGTIIYISPASSKVFGYTSNEMIGKSFGEFLVPEERERLFNTYRENIERRITSRNMLLKALRKDGIPFYAELSTTRILEDESISGRLSLIRDVTDIRLSETRERNRSQILQMLTENVTLEKILYQIQKSIEEEEPESICTILLLDKDGKRLLSRIPNRMPDFYNQAVDGLEIGMGIGSCGTAAFTKLNVFVEDVLTHPYWEPFRELAQKADIGACWSEPIVSVSDQVLGTFAIYYKKAKLPGIVEITRIEYAANLARLAIEKKTSEIELNNYKQHLEDLVNIRTAELQDANNELESFSYSVSHDLRAPLRAIGGFTQMLTETYGNQLDDEGKHICSVIRSSSEKMGQLIDDLLAFSRYGRSGMNPIVINMGFVVKSIIEELTNPESLKRIDITIGTLPEIKADPVLIKQVWINLISNAIKYSSTKEKAIIEISSVSGDKEVTFKIKDSGSGFKMQYVDKLFGVFQRLHKEREFEGTGIGLAIVKRIITRHGGQVWALGQVDEGAEFYFTLPK